VMPSTACSRATTSWPSSSRLRASARTITSWGAGHVLGLLHAIDGDDVSCDLGCLADLGLDEDVCRHHRSRPPLRHIARGALQTLASR
jgi:hypothetical protein